jgi:hypothetical protein
VIALAFVLSILFRRKFDNHCFIWYYWFRVFYFDRSGKKNKYWFTSHYLYCIRNYDGFVWGVIRDILCNETGYFWKEIYATICILGIVFYA